MTRLAYFVTEAWRGMWHHRSLTLTAIASLAGRAEDARDSMRRLRQGMPGATVETCLLQLAARMDPASPAVPAFEAAFRKVWDETPN